MIGMIDRENAHAEGDAARFFGDPFTFNPYKKDSEAHEWWNKGWCERDKEISG